MTAKLDLSQFAGFTPGPLFVHPGVDGRERGYIREVKTEESSDRHVATARVTYTSRTLEEAEANARLYAAAPALIAECRRLQAENERLRGALQAVVRYEDDLPPEGSMGSEVYAQARAALAWGA